VFKSGLCQTMEEVQNRLQANSFFKYATSNWGSHTDNAMTLDPVLSQTILGFLGNQAKVNAASQAMQDQRLLPSHFLTLQSLQGIHLAASLGVESMTKLLIDSGVVDLELRQECRRPSEFNSWLEPPKTPLIFAIYGRHEGIVKLLLENGAKVDSHLRGYGGELIQEVVHTNNVAIRKMLLHKGNFNLNRRNGYGETMFASACKYGSKNTIKNLMETGIVDVNKKDRHSSSPLNLVVACRRYLIVKSLIESSEVDVSAPDFNGESRLFKALDERDGRDPAMNGMPLKIIELFTEAERSDINLHLDFKDIRCINPLLMAAMLENNAVKLLLNTGRVNVNSRDNHGFTALAWAAVYENEELTRLVLNSGMADLESNDKFG
jgi:ankyrin repeat protein